jgi:hypothetical protein
VEWKRRHSTSPIVNALSQRGGGCCVFLFWPAAFAVLSREFQSKQKFGGRGVNVALLTLGHSRCSICSEVLNRYELIVATTHFIADEADPLSRYSDTGMHAACFEKWEHRDEFAARYLARLGRKLSAISYA